MPEGGGEKDYSFLYTGCSRRAILEGRDERNKGKSREDLCRNIIRARVEAFFVKNDF